MRASIRTAPLAERGARRSPDDGPEDQAKGAAGLPGGFGRRRSAAGAYAFALLLGIVAAWLMFPLDFLLPDAGRPWTPFVGVGHGDTAQHVVAQRYFIADAWRWPPVVAANLNTQDGGVHIAFVDAMPLLALALKAMRPLLPDGFHGIALFYGLTWVLQPVAAVWALRGAGERRFLPAAGIALAAISMPFWIARHGHAALSGHFLILAGIGLYFRLVAAPVGPPRPIWAAAAALQVAALLVHPYLAATTLALLAAVPVTRLVRREAFLPDLARTSGCVALVVGVMVAFDYLGAKGPGGYGQFAMNLLSPLWPAGSAIIGLPAEWRVDAIGLGGWEGYNWLGVGLIGGLAVGVLRQPAIASDAVWRHHAGLTIVLLALTLLAVTHRVGFGPWIVIDLGTAPAILEQFRASARFFWPVAYVLLVATMFLLARTWPVLCIGFATVQFADAAPLREALHGWARERPAWSAEAQALRGPLGNAASLTVLPSWPCIGMDSRGETHQWLFEILSLASERAVPANSIYVARWREPPVCRDRELAAAPFAPGEIRVLLPAAQGDLAALIPHGENRCSPMGAALLCR